MTEIGTGSASLGSVRRRSTTGELDRRHGTVFQLQLHDSPVTTRSFAEQVSSSDGSDDDPSNQDHAGSVICTLNDCNDENIGDYAETDADSDDIAKINGFDVFDAFEIKKLTELNTSTRFSNYGRVMVVALSSMFSASFLIHGLLVPEGWNPRYFALPEYEDKPKFLEWLEDGAAGCIYFALGVILPMLTRHRHVQLERTLSVAHRYEVDLNPGNANMFLAYVLWPVTFVLGMLAPVLIWLPRFYGNDIEKKIHIGFWTEVSIFTWSINMLFIGPSRVEEIGTRAIEGIIDGVVKEMDNMRTENICWERVLSKLKATDYLLADTFQWSCLGKLIVGRVSMLFFLAAGFGSVGIVHNSKTTRKGAILCGLMSAICGCAILARLAFVSQKCRNTRPGSRHLAAVLIQKMVAHKFDEEKKKDEEQKKKDEEHWDAFRQLSLYIRERTLGVELLGTRITPEMVGNVALRTCFYLPAGVTVVEGVWNKGKIDA